MLLAASAGDVLQIRPGTYTPASISTGLRILGGPGVLIRSGTLDVRGLPAKETLVLSGIRSADASTIVAISVTRCDGLVHLESIRRHHAPGTNGIPSPISLQIDSSRSVSAVGCQFAASSSYGISVNDSTSLVTLSNCTVVGGTVPLNPSSSTGTDALRATGATLRISNCRTFGGHGFGLLGTGGNGVTLNACECWIGPETSLYGGFAETGFPNGTNGQQIVIRNGRARIDPDVRIVYPNSRAAIATVPSVQLRSISPGSALTPACSGAAGEPMALIVGIAATSMTSPWGPLFIDPTTSAVLYVGPVVENPATLQLLPGLPAGTSITVQGIVALPGEVILTNPAIRVLR